MANTLGNLGRSKIKVLKEMKRVTRRRGAIIASVYNDSDETRDIRVASYEKLNLPISLVKKKKIYVQAYGKGEKTLVSEQFSKSELKKLFHKAGLRVKIRPLTKISYVCVAKVGG